MTPESFERWLIDTTQGAFSPWVARAQISDDRDEIRFRVWIPPHNPLVEKFSVDGARAQSDYLRAILYSARRTIEKKGVRLDPWEFPEASYPSS